MSHAVELELPVEHAFDAVGRMVVAGVGARLGLTVDRSEDLQRALEAVFEQPAAGDTMTVTMTHFPNEIRLAVGPLAGPGEPEELERVLSTLVDELVIDEVGDDIWMTMRLSYRPVATARRWTT